MFPQTHGEAEMGPHPAPPTGPTHTLAGSRNYQVALLFLKHNNTVFEVNFALFCTYKLNLWTQDI